MRGERKEKGMTAVKMESQKRDMKYYIFEMYIF